MRYLCLSSICIIWMLYFALAGMRDAYTVNPSSLTKLDYNIKIHMWFKGSVQHFLAVK